VEKILQKSKRDFLPVIKNSSEARGDYKEWRIDTESLESSKRWPTSRKESGVCGASNAKSPKWFPI